MVAKIPGVRVKDPESTWIEDHIYRVSPKKRNCGFSVLCELKMSYFLTSLDKASSAGENDTAIIKFG